MRYLVTGGAGFIGSNFIRLLLHDDPRSTIINLDALTYAGNKDNLANINSKNHRFIKGDICNAALVNKLMAKTDVVVHFAAETHVDRSLLDASTFVQTDVMGTYTLLNAAKNHNIKKFIHISTDEVYGSREKGSFTEESVINPTNPYSATKAGADRLVYSYHQTFNVPVIITRSSNNFGPNQHVEKFIPLFITNALEDRPLPLYGDGLYKRDWLYVLDNCEAILFLIKTGKIGETYNISAGNERTNISIARQILNHLGKPTSLLHFVKDRVAHDRRYSISSAKLNALGWKPKRRFQTALEHTIKWYESNPQWWLKVKNGQFRKYYMQQYAKR